MNSVADPGAAAVGTYRILESVRERLDDETFDDLQRRLGMALTHFPELAGETVTVACRRRPEGDESSWNPWAEAEFVNRLIRVPTHERIDTDAIFHELAHLAIAIRDERGEPVPKTSERFCSIFAIARQPAHTIERDEIAYLGEPAVPPAEWPRICERALEYREEHGAGSHYAVRAEEWLGIRGGDSA